jgi:hypothetical protein
MLELLRVKILLQQTSAQGVSSMIHDRTTLEDHHTVGGCGGGGLRT